MKRVWKVLALIILVSPGTTVLAQSTIVYVPRFSVLTERVTFPDPDQEGWRFWNSAVSVFNPTGERGAVATVGVYGPDGAIPVGSECSQAFSVEPGSGRDFDGCPGLRDQVGVATLSLPATFIVTAEVETTLRKSWSDGNTPGPGQGYDLGQGRAPMPVFRVLFPAGTRVLAGPVNLGSPRLPEAGGISIEKCLRRVNVTLFNAGDEPAVFTIRALKLRRDSTPILEQQVTLGPKQVQQLNRLPVPILVGDNDMKGGNAEYELFTWITVEATQPYLAYVSSVFDDPEPGALPFEVFPPHRID